MSQKVERYEGRKPVYAPEGPASATSSGPLVAIGTVRAPAYYGDVAEALTGGAGPVERRQATPDEMAAARAREVEPSALPRATSIGEQMATDVVTRSARSHIPEAERMQASRQRGAERHAEVLAGGLLKAARPLPALYPPAPKPSPAIEEESVVEKPAQDVTTETPIEPVADTLAILGDAVVEAIEAEAERTAGELRWRQARAALHAAYLALDAPPPAAVVAPDETEVRPAAEPLVVDVAATVAAVKARREPPAVGALPGKRPYTRPRVAELPLTDRQEKLLAAAVRLRGDRKAVAAEFGLKAHQTVDVVLEIAGKKGRLPASLIPLLPARFAKYTGV